MEKIHLSDVFRFIQNFGQKGHQIGRKIGDAIELITYGAIYADPELRKYLIVEDGLEGESSAKHKVEFCFFQLGKDGRPEKGNIKKLFGFIECKKVGVEQTIAQAFKKWPERSKPFHETSGFNFTIGSIAQRWRKNIQLTDASTSSKTILNLKIDEKSTSVPVKEGDAIAFALSCSGKFCLTLPNESLHNLPESLAGCQILHIVKIDKNKITKIMFEACLPGPQTPEKAKQSSFVALDVRKKITGSFDKADDDSKLSSILVIGEASHWEKKSRSMVRLCIDHVLIIPDAVVIRFFEKALAAFGDSYQDLITKQEFTNNKKLRDCVDEVLTHFKWKVFQRMDSNEFVKPGIIITKSGNPSLILKTV